MIWVYLLSYGLNYMLCYPCFKSHSFCIICPSNNVNNCRITCQVRFRVVREYSVRCSETRLLTTREVVFQFNTKNSCEWIKYKMNKWITKTDFKKTIMIMNFYSKMTSGFFNEKKVTAIICYSVLEPAT